VVVAAGAWSAGLLAQVGLRLPVVPVKGQMVMFKARPGTVSRILLKGERYVIPRRDGRVVVGSTLERAGFDKGITREAREALVQGALSLLPALGRYPIERQWAGLRPGVEGRGGVPLIGAHPGLRGLYVITGHFRNGVVMAPASVGLLLDQILGRRPPLDPRPYALDLEKV
ncbi:MAG: FAD-dependent oxidoreductase, partial [Gammaproteobacteria bacterium]